MKKIRLAREHQAFTTIGSAVALAALSVSAIQWSACGGSHATTTDGGGGHGVDAGQGGQGATSGTGGQSGGGTSSGGGPSGSGGVPGSGGIPGGGGTVGGGGSSGGQGGVAGTGKTQCNDGIDNDGDGKVDLADFECVSALDNDEGSFATGIPGDNVDVCKQDCFFDGNSGMGDDHCNWELKCDSSNVGATAEKKCEYDPNYNNCPASQPQSCLDYCRPLTPNGCDCFGCCQIQTTSGLQTVRLTSTCTAAKADDPTACAPCTQTPTCVNDCKPCELCLGKTTLPAECYGAGGAGGNGAGGSRGIECLNSVSCGTDQSICDKTGTLCISGCCVAGPS